MKLSDISIQRPVLASMMSLALILFGVIGYRQLSVREFPDVDPPIISVSTFLPGANPQVVESAITDILEEELSTVQGIRTLTSSSAEQFSNITIEFTLAMPSSLAAMIYDVAGRPVRTLADGTPAGAGSQRLVWDGRRDDGRPAGSGVYFYRIEAGGDARSGRFVLVK